MNVLMRIGQVSNVQEETIVEEQLGAGSGAPRGFGIWYPQGYNSGGTYPTIIWLHGSGERGNGTTELEDIWTDASAGLARQLHLGSWNGVDADSGTKFIVVMPQQSTAFSGWLGNPGDAVNNDALEFCIWFKNSSGVRFDPNRIYLTGFSMGGRGVVTAAGNASNSPNMFAAISPMSSADATYSEGVAVGNLNIPMLGWIGDSDATSGVNQNYYNGYVSTSPTVDYGMNVFSGGHSPAIPCTHNNTYFTPNLTEWLLQQTL
jgi:predicted peptidase